MKQDTRISDESGATTGVKYHDNGQQAHAVAGQVERGVRRLAPKRAEANKQWKRELALLERAFNCEIEAAINKTGLHLMQTKATKLADKMVEDGLLRKVDTTLRGGPFTMRLHGYELTHAGRLAYCCECA